VVTVLILYEHAITFDKEVEFIWKRKRSPITFLFVANRYGAALYGVLAIVAGYVRDSKVGPFDIIK
jgi:hypothetical protein